MAVFVYIHGKGYNVVYPHSYQGMQAPHMCMCHQSLFFAMYNCYIIEIDMSYIIVTSMFS